MPASARDILSALAHNLGRAILGQPRAIRWLLAAFAGGGHVLLEDSPGTGKTTLAKALALSVSASFKRLQFTADLMPSDIVGISIFDPREQAFRFHEGPVFCHILLADEINRASPRTQSALLEAMAEGQVSAEGVVRPLPAPFFVIATQNPVESHGTYPLPEAQLDRFAMRFGLGHLAPEREMEILAAQNDRQPLADLAPCTDIAAVSSLRQAVAAVRVGDALRRYIVDLGAATRSHPAVRLGASPRASLALQRMAQALAVVDGSDYLTPDHVQEAAVPVLAHRLMLDAQARFSGTSAEDVVRLALESTAVPT